MIPIIGLDKIRFAKILGVSTSSKKLFISTDKGVFIVCSEVHWIDDHCAESYISIPTEIHDDDVYDDFCYVFFDDDAEYEKWKKEKEEKEKKEQLENDKRQLEYAEKRVEELKRKIKIATYLTK